MARAGVDESIQHAAERTGLRDLRGLGHACSHAHGRNLAVLQNDAAF